MKKALLLLSFLTSLSTLFAQDSVIVRKEYFAVRAAQAPRIDGQLDDEAWKSANVTGSFLQANPIQGAPVKQQTEVRIMYDNTALYIGAMLYDSAPDSIMQQLGVRDAYLTADNFRVVFDTYNTQQDAFDFTVTASGVQSDSRMSDSNYDAVWKSAVQILSNGWSVEIEIPYSAIRFPNSKEQVWGLQITRNFQRAQEFDQWALTPRGVQNFFQYWGLLKGISGIEPPLRLSFTPYGTTIVDKDGNAAGAPVSTSFSGGLDLKYGINESFTLDATLLPDFSQVQSDNIVKNLRAFEVQLADNRPFFTEGVDLFSRGGLFYSRRIGKTPTLFYDAPYMLEADEKLVKNPSRSRLLNATKISGRTSNGLGMGILNAFVDNTYAIAQDTVTGEERNILIEPRSNYNIFVLDKQLARGSSVYLINTNVVRGNGWSSANVTGAGTSLNNKKNTWNAQFEGAVSEILFPYDSLQGQFDAILGYQYYARIGKNSGKWQWAIDRGVKSRNFDANDLGITFETNFANNGAGISYLQLNPWKRILQGNIDLNVFLQQNLTTGQMNSFSINPFAWGQFKNFSNAYCGFEINPADIRDYYEPRTPGRVYLRTGYTNFFFGYNSNQNKKLSYSINGYAGLTKEIPGTIPRNPWGGGSIWLNWRAGDRFTLSVGPGYHGDFGDRGWVNTEDDGTIVFGRRNIRNITNTLNATYVFKRDMSLSLISRHYWATGQYLGFYVLEENGNLHDYVNYGGHHDFSFNSFNVDMVYKWIFAPGSTLSIAWKQNILKEDPVIDYNYFHNFQGTIRAPQYNSISLRVLYFLDYLYIKKALAKKG